MKNGNHSPWGTIQHVDCGNRGLFSVSTAGHGGLAISLARAKKELSAKLFARAIIQGGYAWFEEDCDATLVFHEKPEWFKLVYKQEMLEVVSESAARLYQEYFGT